MPRFSVKPPTLEQVAPILRRRYGDHAHYNRRNPMEELLFILCSVKTQESSYLSTYSALREEFPTFCSLAEAPAEYIAKPLATGGLQKQKSEAIRKICDAIMGRFGRLPLAPLRQMDDAGGEEFLTSLPGGRGQGGNCDCKHFWLRKMERGLKLCCPLRKGELPLLIKRGNILHTNCTKTDKNYNR